MENSQEKIPIVILKLETNGLNMADSVLGIFATKIFYDREKDCFLNERKTLERYYYLKPGEIPNMPAIRINNLTEEEITKRRNREKYPKYFYEDFDSIREFFKGSRHFVGHNLDFSLKYLIGAFEDYYNTFDIMKENLNILKIPGRLDYKFPKLMEVASFYNLTLSKETCNSSQVMIEIFKKMHRQSSIEVNKFLNI